MTGFHTFLTLKRIATIPLLALLLFNWIGYRAVAVMVLQHIDAQVEAGFDAGHYGEAPLVSFRIGMPHLPYYVHSGEFERVNGKIRMNGVEYRFVQRRWHNDSLEILCAPDNAAMRLQADCNAFFAGASDLADHCIDSRDHPHKPSLRFTDPLDCEAPTEVSPFVFCLDATALVPHPDYNVYNSAGSVEEPPPDFYLPDYFIA